MIRLTCANCQTQLEVDDAFAGGVCRCKHCGTIQTVPRSGRPATVGKALAGQAAGGDEPKSLYQVKSRAGLASTPSGLEELAEAVHGSGLSGSGLLNRPATRGPSSVPTPPKPKAKKPFPLVPVLVTGVVVLAAAVGWVLMKSGGETPTAAPTSPTAPKAEPAFAGVPLAGNKVVFVLDRGDATSGFFPALRDLTVAAVRGLGPNRLFQVVLWDNGSTDAYPALTPGYATDAEADKLAKWFDGVPTGRSTDALPALKLALAGAPETAVLATGKSLQLDDAFADSVIAARPAKTTITAITLGDTAPDDPLRKIARATGGQFRALSGTDLTVTSK